MSTQQTRDGAKADFHRMQFRILFVYIAIVFIMVTGLTAMILTISNQILSSKISVLIGANSRQLEMNINNYLETVETTSALIFSDEEYYKYDPSNTNLDEYGQIKREESIAYRLVDLDLMENFCDFSILYSTGKRIGLTSTGTSALYGSEELYSQLASYVVDDKQQDVWISGFSGLIDRMYYVKRLNPNAILVTSFYVRELSSAFNYPEQLEGMEICLVDDDNNILYSSNTDLVGQKHSQEIIDVVEGRTSKEASNYFVNVNTCENGWRVICSVSKQIIFKDVLKLRNYAIAVSFLFAIIFMLGGMFIINKLTRPMDKSVSNLEEEATTDRLSGLYNKLAFQDVVQKKLGSIVYGTPQVFVMCDMDNFKLINDTLGHAYGDDVIARMGHMLQNSFGDRFTIGRLGGDEFAMYISSESENEEETQVLVKKDMDILFKDFDTEFAEEKKQIPISLSVGITVQSDERRFNNLYTNADAALYKSKHGGKNQYTFYEKSEEGVDTATEDVKAEE